MNAECGVRSAECGVRKEEGGVRQYSLAPHSLAPHSLAPHSPALIPLPGGVRMVDYLFCSLAVFNYGWA
jgi:hypothetical protein